MKEKDLEGLIKKNGGKLDIEKIARKHGGKFDVEKLAKKLGADIDGEYLLKEIENLKNKPVEKPQKIDESELEKRILQKIPKEKKPPKEIVNPYIEKLPYALKRIDAVEHSMKDVFKRLSFQSSSQTTSFGGEVDKLSQLTGDVKISNPINAQSLVFDSTSGKWINSSVVAGTVVSVASADGSITVTNPTTTVDLSVIKSPILTTGRTISITGDLAYTSPSFDGSGNITALGTLATVNSNVGAFTNASITVNGKGLITAASSGTAPVTSVSGTLNRITSSGGATPVIDISASYVGQSSITTLGTIVTGVWNGTAIIGTYGGTGVNNGTKTFTYLKNISFTAADDTGVYTLPTGTKTLVATDVATLSSLASIGTITTGVWNSSTKIGLAYGGTNADLSATGGTSQYLKQASSGATITVGTISASDIASGAALTKTDDTNVTLTLGGTPSTALLVAASLALGWTGTLSPARGGTGVVNNAASTLTISGNFATTFTVSNTTSVTLPTSGTLATLAGTETLTNKRYVFRVQTSADATSISVNADSFDQVNQTNTQVAGTLTINNPTGTPNDGDFLTYVLKCTNPQTLSFGTSFAGSSDLALPTSSTGSSKIDFLGFKYSTLNSKWNYAAKTFGF